MCYRQETASSEQGLVALPGGQSWEGGLADLVGDADEEGDLAAAAIEVVLRTRGALGQTIHIHILCLLHARMVQTGSNLHKID